MRIEETFRLDAPRDAVFSFLSDGPRVAGCVPGVEEFTECGDGSYEAVLKAQLGPIKAMFTGQVTLETTPPGRLEATGRGQDRASGSRAEIAFTGDLVEVDEGTATQVETVAEVTIRGRLGQFGTGVIRATATEFIREFVACANAQLATDATAAPTESETDGQVTVSEDQAGSSRRPAGASGPKAAPRPTSQITLLLRIIMRMVKDSWSRLVRAVRDRGGR